VEWISNIGSLLQRTAANETTRHAVRESACDLRDRVSSRCAALSRALDLFQESSATPKDFSRVEL
jgi:hypothetical protein